jgi:2-polyprenyl-3-methyl-5-hydroxy-6-metoxy-1,4-benzoquinol methylase
MTDTPTSSSGSSGHDEYFIEAENAAEMARLMLQDRLVTEAMGGVLLEQTDLSQVYQALDVACGPGGWLLDLVSRYPHIQGIGIDISRLMMAYATGQAKKRNLANAHFHVMDVTQPFHFADNTFDLVNARLLTGFLSTRQWPPLIQECKRITRPGGILRLTEAEWAFTNSAAYDQLAQYNYLSLLRAGHSFSPHGRTCGTANMLRLLLRQAGYQDITYHAYAIDYSYGTEAYSSNCQNLLVFHKLIQPFLVQMQIATMEELQQLYKQAEEDIQSEDFCAVDYYLTVWGRSDK